VRHILSVLMLALLVMGVFLVPACATESWQRDQTLANYVSPQTPASPPASRRGSQPSSGTNVAKQKHGALLARSDLSIGVNANAVAAGEHREQAADRLPEPATMVGLGAVLLAVAALARRRFNRT
jgi:hypothetical protein